MPRYPIDTVIGELGRGRASDEAYSFAQTLARNLLSGRTSPPGLAAGNEVLWESYLSILESIAPRSFRLGGGREEADGAVSFLIRFIGKEQGITGELFVRLVTRQIEQVQGDETEIKTVKNWVFEELILEEAKSRDIEERESLHRFDFSPYERFF